MTDTQALTIRPARPVQLAPDSLEQRQRYLADAELRAQLADAIEAEAAALNQVKDNQALWAIGEGGFLVECRLETDTRRMVVTVKAAGESITVFDDRDAGNLIYNRPDHARWPDFLIRQHESLKAQREVIAQQEQAAKNAAELKRQSLI